MSDKTITVFLADDHTIVRQGLAKLLEGEPNLRVVGEAENGREAVVKVEKLKPDIVLMDIAMPFNMGIAISIKTISGFSFSTLTTASRPFSASPITRRSGSPSNSFARPWRTIV